MRILISLAILFTCQVNAQDADKGKPKKLSTEEYIIKKDSSKIVGTVSTKKDKIIVNGVEYELSELLGFRDGKNYRAVIGNSIYYVWALGKIQAYSRWETIGSSPAIRSTSNMCYLRKDSGSLIYYTTRFLFELIKDNEEAVKEFHLHYKKINNNIPKDAYYRRLTKVLAVYNGNEVTDY